MSFTLYFPIPPTRTQDTKGWRGKYFKKEAYRKVALATLMAQWKDLPMEARLTPWPYFEWEMHFDAFHLLDYDNLPGMAKWPMDTLKRAGIIKDDSPKHCKPKNFPTQTIKRKDRKLWLTVHL